MNGAASDLCPKDLLPRPSPRSLSHRRPAEALSGLSMATFDSGGDVDYARDPHTGRLVAAKDASRLRYYECPRPGCGVRVYPPNVVKQRPHFRHWPGQGTSECDEYVPNSPPDADPSAGTVGAAEENPSELGLVLTLVEGRWGLGLLLPEISREELGESSLGALRTALLEVYAGPEPLLRISALELRPGVGAARVDVIPSLQPFRTQPAGSWPDPVNTERWFLESPGLEAKGSLFRLRRGEWMRLLAGSGVHPEETLLLLADRRCAPPHSVVHETYARMPHGGLDWTIWEVRLPSEPVALESEWLGRLGYRLVPRPWSVEVALPPRTRGERAEPVFWVGDSPVLTLTAPRPDAEAMVVVQSGSNRHYAGVKTGGNRLAFLRLKTWDAGWTRLAIPAERDAALDVRVIPRPSPEAVLATLALTPRLRVQIGDNTLEAWQASFHSVLVPPRCSLAVRVDLGVDSARARVTMWERGRRSSRRGLDARGVETAVAEALLKASRIEIDADNLGGIVLLPVHPPIDTTGHLTTTDRLAWRDLVVSHHANAVPLATPTLLHRPGAATSLLPRRAEAAALARARLAIRRLRGPGGTTS